MAIFIGSQLKPSETSLYALSSAKAWSERRKTILQWYEALLSMTTNSLQHVENHLLLLGRQTAQERVGAFLIEMNGRQTSADVINLPMTRRDIADYLGLTIETVSRVLSNFQRKRYLKFLDQMQRQFVVLNAAGLTELDDSRGAHR